MGSRAGSDAVLNGKWFRQIICVERLAIADDAIDQVSHLMHDGANDGLF